MKNVPVCLGDFVASRRPALATTVGWRDLVHGCAICLAGVALLVLLTTVVVPRDGQPDATPQLADAPLAAPQGKFGH